MIEEIILAANLLFPTYSQDQERGQSYWHDHEGRMGGIVKFYDRNDDGITDLNIAYLKCKAKYIKFGAYDFNTNKLYLDYDLDGIVDIAGETESTIFIRDTVPKCKYRL